MRDSDGASDTKQSQSLINIKIGRHPVIPFVVMPLVGALKKEILSSVIKTPSNIYDGALLQN